MSELLLKELVVTAPIMQWTDESPVNNPLIKFLPEMRTDIVLKHKRGEQTLIIDTKYYSKILIEHHGKMSLRSDHLYQIFAYVKNLDKDNTGNVSGLLLYAKTEEEFFPDGEPFIIGGNRIGAKTLDLNQKFDMISAQLDLIVDAF